MGKFFSKEYEVVIIQYPGRLNRVDERNLESIKSYSDELFGLLNKLPEKNNIFFGHSTGGLIAYNYSINFSHKKNNTNKYIISSFNFKDKLSKQIITENEILQLLSLTDPITMEKISNDKSLQFKNLILPPLINDFNVVSTYKVPFLSIKEDIIVVFGKDDKSLNRKNMEDWKKYSNGRVEIIEFPGGHFYFQGNEETVFNRIIKIGRKLC